jgi:predicted phage terminase large subunit-like protein
MISEYPKEYTHGIPIEYPAPVGLTWPQKVNEEFAEAIKTANPMLWATQYQQVPTVETGEIFHKNWWQFYEAYDPVNSQIVLDDEGTRVAIRSKHIYADTAMKKEERHDFSVFQYWASLATRDIALIEQERGKWEAPDLETEFKSFIERFKFVSQVNNMGVRSIKVEDKASGIGLIQALNKKIPGRIEGIPRDKDKVSRAKSCAPQIKLGKVWLPRGKPWITDYILEFTRFNSEMTHKHDDQIDATLDAINDLIIQDTRIGYGGVI